MPHCSCLVSHCPFAAARCPLPGSHRCSCLISHCPFAAARCPVPPPTAHTDDVQVVELGEVDGLVTKQMVQRLFSTRQARNSLACETQSIRRSAQRLTLAPSPGSRMLSVLSPGIDDILPSGLDFLSSGVVLYPSAVDCLHLALTLFPLALSASPLAPTCPPLLSAERQEVAHHVEDGGARMGVVPHLHVQRRERDAARRGAPQPGFGAAARNPDAATCTPDAAESNPDAAARNPDAATCKPDAAACNPDAATRNPDSIRRH